jgi:hypothetical protein
MAFILRISVIGEKPVDAYRSFEADFDGSKILAYYDGKLKPGLIILEELARGLNPLPALAYQGGTLAKTYGVQCFTWTRGSADGEAR